MEWTCTVERNHNISKKSSWTKEGCTVKILKSATGHGVLLVRNGKFEFAVSLNQKIRVITSKDGFGFRSSHADSYLSFIPESVSLNSLHKVLSGPIETSNLTLYEGKIEDVKRVTLSNATPIKRFFEPKPSPSSDINATPVTQKKAKTTPISYNRLKLNNDIFTSPAVTLKNSSTSAIKTISPLALKPIQLNDTIDRYISKDGFKNMGLTCYIGCVLQLICNSSLKKSILSFGAWFTQNHGSESVYECLCTILKTRDKQTVDVRLLRDLISNESQKFVGSKQEDAQEFFIALLNRLCWSTLKELHNINIEQKEVDVEDPTVGMSLTIQHSLLCKQCGNTSNQIETYLDLSLAITKEASSLIDLLDGFFKPEIVEYTCPKCPSKEATLSHKIDKCPKTLLIHLKRFDFHRNQKLLDKIRIPHRISLCDYGETAIFHLKGVISHLGDSLSQGHYVYDFKNGEGQWDRYDDSYLIHNSKGSAEIMRNAYILLLERADD